MSEWCRNIRERLDNGGFVGFRGIDCEIIDKLIISEPSYSSYVYIPDIHLGQVYGRGETICWGEGLLFGEWREGQPRAHYTTLYTPWGRLSTTILIDFIVRVIGY